MSAAALTRSLARLSVTSGSLANSSIALRTALLPQHLPSVAISVRSYASEASSAIRLGNLKPGQPKKGKKILGRGSSSGRGGTSTRGHKGQKSRSGNGKPSPGFEGGQTPITRLFPKRGFINAHAQTYIPVNLDKIQHWIDRGLLDPSKPITIKELFESRCIHGLKDGVKILGEGAGFLKTPINLVVSRASQSAIAAVEQAGGTVECRYYTMLTLRALVKPEKFHAKLLPRQADPIAQRQLLWYSSPRNRGYLAKRHAFQEALAAANGQADASFDPSLQIDLARRTVLRNKKHTPTETPVST